MNKQSEHELEQLFAKAYEDENFREDFISQLLEANVYFPGKTSDGEGRTIHELYLQEGENVQIKSWPNEEFGRVIPFFTSLETMRQAFDADENFICMPCKVLFKMTLGALLVLNPESVVSKPFYPEEIQQLLDFDGELFQSSVIEEDQEIMVAQPEHQPYSLFKDLSSKFKKMTCIQSAYFSLKFNPKNEEEPAYIIALLFNELLTNEKIESVHQNILDVVKLHQFDQSLMEILHLDFKDKDGLHGYFLNEVRPFYEKEEKKKGFFAKLFS